MTWLYKSVKTRLDAFLFLIKICGSITTHMLRSLNLHSNKPAISTNLVRLKFKMFNKSLPYLFITFFWANFILLSATNQSSV